MEFEKKNGWSKNGVFSVDVWCQTSTEKNAFWRFRVCWRSTRKPASSVDLQHPIWAENHASRSQNACRTSTSLAGAFSNKIKQNGAKIGPKWAPKWCQTSTRKPAFSVDLQHPIWAENHAGRSQKPCQRSTKKAGFSVDVWHQTSTRKTPFSDPPIFKHPLWILKMVQVAAVDWVALGLLAIHLQFF